ncbi:MAG: polyprenol monophosphomannose synthase [Bdellovibrionales bacterium]|nr:polyprenol monophosphomannose synthase [Bdellovibrionales bacterium]
MVLVCIPTYNEVENIEPITTAVLGVTPETVHVLVIDDGSPDGTGQVADGLAAKNNRIHVLHRKQKQGLGPAYIAGFKWGFQNGFDHVIEMDADFSHNPRFLPAMLENLAKNDFVIGSRYVRGGGTVNWGIMRKIISKGGSLYARLILGAPINDFTGGFNGWHRKVIEAINLDTLEAGGYSFQIELKYRAFKKGFRFAEFPILFEDRRVGKSKMSSKIVVEALGLVPRLRLK